MAEPTNDPKEKQVNKILAEDKDSNINPQEIARIFKLYLGRPATADETDRFNGVLESEKNILIDYLNQQRETFKQQADTSKVKNNLALKSMKAMGEQSIAAIKGNPVIPSPEMLMAANPMSPESNMNEENEAIPPNRYIRDGRYSLVKFT